MASEAKWRAMSDLEGRACTALGICRYPVASFPKRLARSLAAQADAKDPRITDRQAWLLWRQAWRFRRQIVDRMVIAEAQRQGAHEQLRDFRTPPAPTRPPAGAPSTAQEPSLWS